MPKKDWEKTIKKLFTSRGVDTLKIEPTPYRDWGIIVGVFFLGLIVSLGFNVYMSMKINSDDFFVAPKSEANGPVLNKIGLEKVLTELSEKETYSLKVIKEGVSVIDPSL